MSYHLGFREIIVDHSTEVQWKTISIDTGAAQGTLQDIKVPEYGGSYMYKHQSPSTQNRYIFWRVFHNIVEIWEETLDINFQFNHVQLKFTDTPVLEGLSVHETNQHVVILLATVSSVHQIKLPHPLSNTNGQHNFSVFKDLTALALREYHNHHVINNNSTGEGLPHTAATHYVSTGVRSGESVFVLGQNGGSLLVVTMTNLPYSVHCNTIKASSLINRFITGFVPSMFRGLEGKETVSSIILAEINEDVIALGQRHLIRTYSSVDVTYIAVFLSFAEKQMIVLFAPSFSMGHLTLQLIKTMYPPQYDLLDLTLLYSLVNFNGGTMNTPGLRTALLESFPEKDIQSSDPAIDPSEIYLKELLAPNRFSAYTIQKALSIYRRNDASIQNKKEYSPSATGLWKLADEIESSLKEEIDLHITTDMTEEEVLEVKHNAWTTFYSHTLQYHQVARKPISIVGVGGEGLVSIIRKQSVTWIRPLDALEFLMLVPSNPSSVTALSSTPILSEDSSIALAVTAIAKPLRLIDQSLDPEVASAFMLDMYHLEPPDQIAASIAMSLISGTEMEVDSPLTRVITNQISGVPGIIDGFQAYLRALELDMGNPDALTLELNGESVSDIPSWLSGAFCSRLGSSLVGAVVSQFSEHRLQMCRNLLLLQHILLQLNILSPENNNKIQTTLLPKTTLLAQAYFALNRVSNIPSTIPTPANIETSRRQMAALSLSDTSPVNSYLFNDFPPSVLELFIHSSGGVQARSLVKVTLEEEGRTKVLWSTLLMPLATTVAQLTWPISKCLAFLEFLVWGNQHFAAQEYVRLLRPWCEWNSCSRKFLLGISTLNEGEARKAHNLLLTSSEGVGIEEYLGIKIAGASPDATLQEVHVQFCLKVIRLLEQNGYISLALEVAKSGIELASVEDPGLSALYSVSFKYHLELGHHDEAFTALMACPDEHRRRNCLRQLIITLYDRKCLSSLVTYNYGVLESEVIMILENRARSADILVTNYYDLLFAFHISKHNYKKAGWVMYECALRLNKEGLGERGLHQQAKCFLTCINCLKHIPSDQAWIIKPISRISGTADSSHKSEESSDSALGRLLKSKKRAQITVLTVTDLEREYQLVHARLKLFKFHSSSSNLLPGGPMSASDTVSLLIYGKLFRDALKICRLFELSTLPVLEGLALTCCDSRSSMQDQSNLCQLLSENGITRDTCQDAGWWSLLRQILEEEEKGKQSVLHKVVASTLLERGVSLPGWFCDSYKKRNCGEFIQLYINKGFIEEAGRLFITLIEALLGNGNEQMDITPLYAFSPPIWVPYNTLDHLLLELKELQKQKHYKEIYEKVTNAINKYQTELKRVSFDMILVNQV
ncbi:Nuclear pore complex protein, partial [Armadillidium nasatum]